MRAERRPCPPMPSCSVSFSLSERSHHVLCCFIAVLKKMREEIPHSDSDGTNFSFAGRVVLIVNALPIRLERRNTQRQQCPPRFTETSLSSFVHHGQVRTLSFFVLYRAAVSCVLVLHTLLLCGSVAIANPSPPPKTDMPSPLPRASDSSGLRLH